jgi:hypothetical protein
MSSLIKTDSKGISVSNSGTQLLILNFEGENGAVTWEEESHGRVPVQNTNHQIDIADKKFGNSSLVFVGNGVLEYSIEAISGDLTFHGWQKVTNLSSWSAYEGCGLIYLMFLSSQNNTSEALIQFYGDSPSPGINGVIRDSGHNVVFQGELGSFGLFDGWFHFAFVVRGRSIMYFLNGILQSTWTAEMDNPMAGIDRVFFNINNMVAEGSLAFKDAYELLNYARWTRNFNPPLSAPSL